MSKHDDGGPAFPSEGPYVTESGMREPQEGMTLLDWFAGQALAGMLANPDAIGATEDDGPEVYALWAHRYADEMIAEKRRREINNG